jgi:hypothetical protein
MFVIEDERHAEVQDGKFSTREEAISELENRAKIAWDEHPNVAPCTNWSQCGRSYELIEYDDSTSPWTELSQRLMLEISKEGVRWYLPDSAISNS